MSKNRNRARKHKPKYGDQANMVVLRTAPKNTPPRKPPERPSMITYSQLVSMQLATNRGLVSNYDNYGTSNKLLLWEK